MLYHLITELVFGLLYKFRIVLQQLWKTGCPPTPQKEGGVINSMYCIHLMLNGVRCV